ncbi:MAG: CinA family protein [Lachnospiraceae bacterium]|nr:CinA family protein [Lachnospiraceae bacterium]
MDQKLMITTAESCTGGLIASAIVDLPGVPKIYQEGYVTYSNEAKEKLLGVSSETIEQYGVVSEQTAIEMAKGAAKKAKADIALTSTGVAGPDGGTKEHPVGEVYLGCYCKGRIRAVRMLGTGSRTEIRMQAAERAFCLLDEMLSEERS